MMQRIEASRSLPMPIAGRRGASSDAITEAGGNPAFRHYPPGGQRVMTDTIHQTGAARPTTITVVDKNQTLQVTNVDQWIEERKQLLRHARAIVKDYDGNASLLRPQYDELVRTMRRLAEIKVIFDTYTNERNRHIDANITVMVTFLNDPQNNGGDR